MRVFRMLGFALISGLSACSQQSFDVQKLGTSMLALVGLGPAVAVYDAVTSVQAATQTLTREEEYYLGRAVSAQILTRYPALENETVNHYVASVGAAVAQASSLPNTFGGYHFQVLATDEVNAMAAPGGFIFVTTGMLKLLPDEDALAAVLAHEVTHVAEQHGLKAISQDRINDIVTSMGQLAGSLNCSEVLQQAGVIFTAAVDDVVNTLVLAGYSKDLEYAADKGSSVILAQLGYEPQALEVVLDQLMLNEAKSKKSGWFATHPEAHERKDALGDAIHGSSQNLIVADGRVHRLERFNAAIRANL